MFVAFAGGVGGAKLAQGLTAQLSPEDLLCVVNTGDDFEHLGLRISPDLDTVMYWLAGLNDADRGWGIADETWNFMAGVRSLNGPTWFNIGDRDLATHLCRTRRFEKGDTLSKITDYFRRQLGIKYHFAPMSDQSVATVVHTNIGALPFQDYFVRLRCEPVVVGIAFEGTEKAAPSPAFAAAMTDPKLRGVIVCPSNPFLSIEPILSLSLVRPWLWKRKFPVVAVSPIIAGQAVKGPAAKIMRELGFDVSAVGIARHYEGLVDGLVIDQVDEAAVPQIEALGMRAMVAPTLMKNDSDRSSLAARVLELAAQLAESAYA